MDRRAFALLAGSVSCLAVIATIAVPYAMVPPQGTDMYYSFGLAGPLAVGVLALLVLVLFAVGDRVVAPPLVAGVALVVALGMVVVSAVWALAVPPSLVMELSRTDELIYHRWVVVGLAVAVLASVAWYTGEAMGAG